jgi:hypothetical protein
LFFKSETTLVLLFVLSPVHSLLSGLFPLLSLWRRLRRYTNMRLSLGILVFLTTLTVTTYAASDVSFALAKAQASYPKCTVSTNHSLRKHIISNKVLLLAGLSRETHPSIRLYSDRYQLSLYQCSAQRGLDSMRNGVMQHLSGLE